MLIFSCLVTCLFFSCTSLLFLSLFALNRGFVPCHNHNNINSNVLFFFSFIVLLFCLLCFCSNLFVVFVFVLSYNNNNAVLFFSVLRPMTRIIVCIIIVMSVCLFVIALVLCACY